jgi:hypothetical protein
MNFMIPVHQAKRYLDKLVEQACFSGKFFALSRGQKLRAVLIGVQEFSQILKVLEKHDPAWLDTLAIMANPELQSLLEQDNQDLKTGRGIAFDETLLKQPDEPQQSEGSLQGLSPPLSLEETFGSVTPIHRPEDFAALRTTAIEEHVEHVIEEMKTK